MDLARPGRCRNGCTIHEVILYIGARTKGGAEARRVLEATGKTVLVARDYRREPHVLYGDATFVGLAEIKILASALRRECL